MTAAVTDLAAYRQRLRKAGLIRPAPADLTLTLLAASVAFWAAWWIMMGGRLSPPAK